LISFSNSCALKCPAVNPASLSIKSFDSISFLPAFIFGSRQISKKMLVI
jgi:hypothetical protein